MVKKTNFQSSSGFLQKIKTTQTRSLLEQEILRFADEILGTGVDVWKRRLMGEDFAPYGGMETAKQLFWLFRKCGLANLIARTTSFLNMHTPIVLTLKKIPDQNQRNEY